MEIKQIPLRHLKCNEGQIEGLPTNPRQIDEEHLDKLKRSLQEAPEMLNLRELIVMPHGKDYIVIGGNMRLRAIKPQVLDDGIRSSLLRCDYCEMGKTNWRNCHKNRVTMKK